MASTGFADYEQHYFALFEWIDQGRLKSFQSCRNLVSRRVPCKIDGDSNSLDWAATLLLGRSWKRWNQERHARTLELLDLYERAGYIDGTKLLAPCGVKVSTLSTRRQPLTSAVHFKNAAATVLLLDRGLLKVTDVRPHLADILHRLGAAGSNLQVSDLTPVEAFSHLAALTWKDDPEGLAAVSEALMRHHIHEHGAAPAAKGDVGASGPIWRVRAGGI